MVTVTLRDAEGGFKGSGVDMVWPGSWFYVDLADAQSEPVTVTGGDEIIVTATGGAMTYSVPSLTAVLYQQTGLLTGNAPAGLWLSAALDRAKRQVQVGPDGTFSLDWSDYSPSFGEHGNIWVTDDLGNEVRLYFTVSYHYGYNIFLPLVNRGG